MGNMTDLVARLREAIDAEEVRLNALPPFPWKLNPDDDAEVWAADDIFVAEAFALSSNQQRLVAQHIVAGSPERGLRRCAADRKILDLHRSYDEEYPDYADPDRPERQCVGCGFDGQEEVRIADVNRCPVVGALAEAYGVEP